MTFLSIKVSLADFTEINPAVPQQKASFQAELHDGNMYPVEIYHRIPSVTKSQYC